MLTWLYGFGPKNLRSEEFRRWWDGMLTRWSHALDMIIWLDAPDAVLVERIHRRDSWHFVKEKSKKEAAEFLARYRTSYERIIPSLIANNGPTVLRFDTAQESLARIVEQALVALGAGRRQV